MRQRSLSAALFLSITLPAQVPDDARWQAIPSGPDGPVAALASYQGQIVAGGFFTSAGGVTAGGIARWDGANWNPLGPGLVGGGGRGSSAWVLALHPFAGGLVAGGDFIEAGGQTTKGVASWNGSTWTVLPDIGFPGDRIGPFATYGGELISSGVIFGPWIKRWNGTAWVALGPDPFLSGLATNPLALGTFQGELIAGAPPAIEGNSSTMVSAWNGASWRAVASGNGNAFAMTVYNGELIVAGSFSSLGGVAANGIARFDGSTWRALGTGLGGTGRALAVLHGRLFVGGSFATAGGMLVNGIARWDGGAWAPLGSGVAGLGSAVSALATSGDDLLVGGYFEAVAGQPTANIAIWHDPSDTVPPNVTILAPVAGALVRTLSIAVTAQVDDASATTVSSTPAGVAGALPPGGGLVAGNVPLDSEGDNLITVSAVDAFNNPGGTSVIVTRDTIAPVIVSSTPADGAIVSSATVGVTVVVQDVHASIVQFGTNALPLPAGGGNASGDVTLVEGANNLPIAVTDAAGNATFATLALRLDTTAPTVLITEPASDACFGPADRTVTVRAEITDTTTTLATLTPGGAGATLPPGSPALFAAPATLVEGTNTIVVTARDVTDHVGSHSISVTLDTTPPIVAVVSPLHSASVAGIVDFHAQAQDLAPGGAAGSGVAGISLSLDQVQVAAQAEIALDTRGLADGVHTLCATAVDAKGNASAPACVTVLVDNTAPAVTVLEPDDQELVTGTRRFRVTASDAGAQLVSIALCAEGPTPVPLGTFHYPSPVAQDAVQGDVNTLQFPDGPLTLAAIVTDGAGNVTTVRRTVLVRNAAPPLCTLTPGDGSVVSGLVAISAAVTGGFASVELRIDGVSAGSSASSPLVVTFDTRSRLDGAMLVQAIVTDPFATRSTFTVTLTVDNIDCEFAPTVLNLKSKGDPLHARLEGHSVGLLLPTELHGIQLRVPGGSPVPSEAGWNGDDTLKDDDRDGVLELNLRFSRQALSASIRAGVASGAIHAGEDVPVTLVAGGGTANEVVLHVVRVRLVGQ